MISKNLRNDLLELRDSYNNLSSWVKYFFFPKELGNALSNFTQDSVTAKNVTDICSAFLNDTWFFQRWFFSGLNKFNYTKIISALHWCKEKALLPIVFDQERFNAIIKHNNPLDVVEALDVIHNDRTNLVLGYRTQYNSTSILKHDKPLDVINALRLLARAGLLGPLEMDAGNYQQNILNVVINHKAPCAAANLLTRLNKLNLLNSDNCVAVLNHQRPRNINDLLSMLERANLLQRNNNQRYFDIAVNYSSMLLGDYDLIHIFAAIRCNDFTQQHFDDIVNLAETHKAQPDSLRLAIIDYANRKILPADQQYVCINYKESYYLQDDNSDDSNTDMQVVSCSSSVLINNSASGSAARADKNNPYGHGGLYAETITNGNNYFFGSVLDTSSTANDLVSATDTTDGARSMTMTFK